VRALLALWFDDVRPEEWTPRMDFLIKEHQLVVETKKTRKGLGAKKSETS
jgi:hypothetical protein